MKKKILIFGGTGNISKYLTNLLAGKSEYEVSILNHNGRRVENVRTIKADVNNLEELKKISLEKFDVVFDFLLFTAKEAEDRIKIFEKHVKQYFFISSTVVFDRENNILINEKVAKKNPYSQYGRDKIAAEEVFLKSSIPYTIIRPSHTYSDTRLPLCVKGKKIYPVIQRIIDGKEVIINGDGTNLWPCMHSEDMADILSKLILKEKAIREDFNVCGQEYTNFNMIYTMIAKKLNKDLKVVYITSKKLAEYKEYDFETALMGDKRYSCIFDLSKLESVIGKVNLKINMEEGIRRYLNESKNKEEKDDDFNIWCDKVILENK